MQPLNLHLLYSAFEIEKFSVGIPFDILMKIWQKFLKKLRFQSQFFLHFGAFAKKLFIKSDEFPPNFENFQS